MPEHHSDQPTADAESKQSVESAASATSSESTHPEPRHTRHSWYRRLLKWMVARPERSASLVVAIAALVVAAVSAFAAVQSLNVASNALSDQTATDKMTSDLTIRSFASKVVLWSESTAASGTTDLFPSILYVQNLNNAPLGATSIIIGANFKPQFGSDGFGFTNTFSFQQAFTLGRMSPCSQYVINNANGSVGRTPGLFFVDNNDLAWYQGYTGVLMQIELSSNQLAHLYQDLSNAPVLPRSQADFGLLSSGCS